MRLWIKSVVLFLLAALTQVSAEVTELSWDDLMPQDFDLYEEQSKIFSQYDIEKLIDGTPEAEEALARVQALSDNAPIVAALDGNSIKIPGFAVPLEYQERVTRFLLVPYFGACIHTPPPPSNQIILVEPAEPVPLRSLQGALYGTITVDQIESDIAISGYHLDMIKVEPYQ